MNETEQNVTEEQEVKLAQFRELTEMMKKVVESKKYNMDVYVATMVSHLATIAFSQKEREYALKQLHDGLNNCFNDLKSEFGDHQCPH